jgi:hypothetical protein
MIPTPNLCSARVRGATATARTQPVPPVELREQLAAARRAGASFDQAWPGALKAAVNASQWERAEWLEALSGTVRAWRAGWERQLATRPERALAMLVMPGGEPLPERACEQCSGEIPPERDKRALFCSDGCAKHAAYLRERERATAPGLEVQPRALVDEPIAAAGGDA